jgi:hypothetical protein
MMAEPRHEPAATARVPTPRHRLGEPQLEHSVELGTKVAKSIAQLTVQVISSIMSWSALSGNVLIAANMSQ